MDILKEIEAITESLDAVSRRVQAVQEKVEALPQPQEYVERLSQKQNLLAGDLRRQADALLSWGLEVATILRVEPFHAFEIAARVESWTPNSVNVRYSGQNNVHTISVSNLPLNSSIRRKILSRIEQRLKGLSLESAADQRLLRELLEETRKVASLAVQEPSATILST